MSIQLRLQKFSRVYHHLHVTHLSAVSHFPALFLFFTFPRSFALFHIFPPFSSVSLFPPFFPVSHFPALLFVFQVFPLSFRASFSHAWNQLHASAPATGCFCSVYCVVCIPFGWLALQRDLFFLSFFFRTASRVTRVMVDKDKDVENVALAVVNL